MRVVVVGDVSHVVVDVVLEGEVVRNHRRQPGAHVGQVLFGWFDAVVPPHDHRNRADLTLRDPADVVLMEPRGYPRRFAEIAVGAHRELVHRLNVPEARPRSEVRDSEAADPAPVLCRPATHARPASARSS